MHRYTPLRHVFPRPKAIPMAGEVLIVGEFTLEDLAQIDHWLASTMGEPFDDLPALALDAAPGTRKRRLVTAWDRLSRCPDLGTAEAVDWLNTPEGRAVQVLVACARGGHEIVAGKATELVEAASPAEWAAFDRAAWGVLAWKCLAREIDPDFEAEPVAGQDPYDWGLNLARLAEQAPWTFPDLARLTIGQFRLLCRGGEPEWYRTELKDGETPEQLVARSVAMFAPEDDVPSSRQPDDRALPLDSLGPCQPPPES